MNSSVMSLDHEPVAGLSKKVIGFAIEVHRHLGPGLLESSYEDGLCWELSNAGISFRRQVGVPVRYKGTSLGTCYRPDLIVDESLIVEVKAIEKLIAVHDAQLLTYLRHTGIRLGLLFNFNAVVLKDGMKRIVL